jgi:subtilisin-like proprotein convertase family protein
VVGAAPAPNQNFVVWKVEAAVSVNLAPGTYWVEWQTVGGAGQRVFALMSQPIGARTLPGYNGVNTFNSGPWQPTLDAGNPASLPDVPIDYCFGVDYTALPCTSPTSSVLSQVLGAPVPTNLYNETFNTVAPLPAGWASQNLSNPVGATGWFQGNVGVFPGNTPPGYIAANFNNTTGNNIISNWLFAPNVTLKNGDQFSFWTRTTTGTFPDRLQVRMSTNGASTNAGATNTSVGDFTTLLLDINPTYTSTGYPTAWTKYTLTLSGLPGAGVSGRIALRYFVEGGGPAGANSDYIGIDDVIYTTFNPGPITTCVGSVANLKVDITGGNPPYNVVINRTPGGLLNVPGYISGSNIPVTPTVTTTYNLVSVTGCGVGTGNSGTPTITVLPATVPTISIQENPTGPLCAGSPKLLTVTAPPVVAVFANPAPITIPIGGVGTPYPSNITVSGFPTTGISVSTVRLFGVNHTWGNDVDVLLQSPTGQNVILMSDVGGIVAIPNATYTFSDAGPFMNVGAANPTGTYHPTNSDVAENFPAPGPGPIAQAAPALALFGNVADVNGVWKLFVMDDDGSGDQGVINGGWDINFTPPPPPPPPIPPGTTFLWSPATGISSTTSNPTAASPMVTTTYTVLATFPGGCQTTASVLITVNQLPAVTSNPVNKVACVGATVTFTVGATGSNITYQWQESTTGAGGPWNNINNGGVYGGATTPTLTLTGVTALMNNNRYRCVINGICPPPATSNNALLTVNGLPVIQITPPGPVCGGVPGINGTLIVAGSAAPPIPGTVTVNSGTINLTVPDNTANGVSNDITMAGVPANATITNVAVTLNNFSHTYPGDMIIHLKAPNGQILNLYKYGSGLFTGPASGVPTWGWYGAKVSQLGTVAWSTVAVAPFIYNNSTPWRADAINTPVAGAVIQNPTGFVSAATSFNQLYTTPASTNGVWTLAMCDGGPGDIGTLASWGLTIEYTTPGGGGNPLTYTWSPAAGLYTNATATTPYIALAQTDRVYAAPTVNTVYTVTGTDGTTGCSNTGTIGVIYTPPAPTVAPPSVAMCLGDPAVALSITSSLQPATATFTSGPISVVIPDGPAIPPVPASYPASVSTIPVALPAGATILSMSVKLNITHAYVGDVVAVLKAPNGKVFNLDAMLNRTNNPGANFVNTVISSTGTTLLSAGTAPFTATFKPDAAGATFTAFGFTFPGGPAGYIPDVATFSGLYSQPSGNWTLALYDAGAPDAGLLTNWSLDFTYGVPASGIWSPVTGLYNDAAATSNYVAGTSQNTVYAKPATTTAYSVTVSSLGFDVFPAFTNPAPITIPSSGTGTPYPSNISVTGLPTTGVAVESVVLRSISHTWSDDIDVLLQSPTGQNVVLMSDVGGANPITNVTYTFRDGAAAMGTGANATGTYRPTNFDVADNWPAPGPGAFAQATPSLSLFGSTANVNGTWKLFVVDDTGGDQGQIANGWGITFRHPGPGCVSPARTVNVTVNTPTTVVAQPVNTTICTDKVATFSVVAGGTGPFSYQWQVSSDNGNSFSNITNGGVYSGATTATLTITAPPVTMNSYAYRCIITGAAPCAPATSFFRILTVNPLPTIVIAANPTKLLPGMKTNLTSTVTPNAADPNGGYQWLRDGVAVTSTSTGIVSGVGTNTLTVDVDGQGTYQLRVRDVNGCTNVSNPISITDSVSGKCFVYPNPSSGKFQVRYYSAANNVLPRGVQVYDAKGDKVLAQNYIVGRPYDRMDVDLRKFGKGLYWVEIVDTNGNRLTMCRVVIQ